MMPINRLDPLDYKAVLAFRTQLETVIPILDLRVFGSRCRGDAREDSDLDIFIKVDKIDRSLRERIYDIAWEVGFEYDRLISTFVVTERQIKEEAVGASPLLAKVLREGIVPVIDPQLHLLVKYRLAEAEETGASYGWGGTEAKGGKRESNRLLTHSKRRKRRFSNPASLHLIPTPLNLWGSESKRNLKAWEPRYKKLLIKKSPRRGL